MATITHTPLSPPPRYPVPLRPRYNTNPSGGNNGGSTPRSRRSTADRSAATGSLGKAAVKLLPVIPGHQIDPRYLSDEPSTAADPMSVDPPTPSPAISTNAISEFPLPPQRPPPPIPMEPESGSSSSSHGMSSRQNVRPLPARPGPPKPELIPEWEPDVKVHIPESATLDARIASYSRFAEPPPKLRSKVLAREQGVPIALEVDPSSTAAGREGRQAPRRGMLNAPPTGERERLGRLRKPAVNGLLRIEKGSTPASSQGKGKMRDTALHLVSDLSGIAGEWTLDPALPRLGSIPSSASRPSLGAYSTRSALSASGSRNSLLTSEQGHSMRSSGTDSSLDLTGESTASIWKKRKRLPQDIGETRRTLPTAVFETDKGNIDVRLAVVDDASFPVTGVRTGDTTTERYMQGATERKGLLNARVEGDGALTNGLGAPSVDSCARVEVLTRKGNVRVEVPELQQRRQVALQVISRDGNIFLSIPETFVGPIQCSTAPGQSVLLLPSLKARVETLYDDRGESLYYLGQRPSGNKRPPLLPPRRLSNRLRRLSQGSSTPVQEYTNGKQSIHSSSGMDVDPPLLLPNASKITHSSTDTFIPTASPPRPRAEPLQTEEIKESSVYASSYTGSICIGLHGLEPKHVFKGATTLTGLLEGLGDARKSLKDRIQLPASGSRHFV